MMTASEAKANQDRIAKHFSLSHWYGVNCDKCCGVYPKLMLTGSSTSGQCFYQCEVCGKQTKPQEMPWLSRELWNAGNTYFEERQMTLWESC